MISLISRLNRLSRVTVLALALALLALMGLLDYRTGAEIGFSIFYLIPVALATWYLGRTAGMLFCVLGAAIWLGADIAAGHAYSHPLIAVWNASIRLAYFFITSFSLSFMKFHWERERAFARTDSLTGIPNSRAFMEEMQKILEAAAIRHEPVHLAFLDMDGLKAFNDRFGHAEGDRALRIAARALRENIRGCDIFARLGGDEFVVLLTRQGPAGAWEAMQRIHGALTMALKSTGYEGAGFSAGLVSFEPPFPSLDEMIRRADALMYQVKNSGKGAVKHEDAGAAPPR